MQLWKIHYSSHFLLYKEHEQTTRRFYALKTFSAMKKERVKVEVSQGKTSDSHSSHGNMVQKNPESAENIFFKLRCRSLERRSVEQTP